MVAKNNKSFLFNQRGVVILETIPLIWVIFVLLGATLGSWGIVHTAIMNSISSRHNAFFILNHRSDLNYLRDFGPDHYPILSRPEDNIHRFYYGNIGSRFFFVQDENFVPGENTDSTATGRFVNFIKKDGYDVNQSDFLKSSSEHMRIGELVSRLNQKN